MSDKASMAKRKTRARRRAGFYVLCFAYVAVCTAVLLVFVQVRPASYTGGTGVGVVNPTSNIRLPAALSAQIRADCVVYPVDNSNQCTASALAAINYARSAEGVAPMVLPQGWAGMSVADQTLTVVNLERQARGLVPYRGLSAPLSSLAEQGAIHRNDPNLPSGDWGSSIWAGGYNSVLLADFGWMYLDGPGGPNVECVRAGASGCFQHRDAILWRCSSCSVGVGFVGGSDPSLAAEFVGGPGYGG